MKNDPQNHTKKTSQSSTTSPGSRTPRLNAWPTYLTTGPAKPLAIELQTKYFSKNVILRFQVEFAPVKWKMVFQGVCPYSRNNSSSDCLTGCTETSFPFALRSAAIT